MRSSSSVISSARPWTTTSSPSFNLLHPVSAWQTGFARRFLYFLSLRGLQEYNAPSHHTPITGTVCGSPLSRLVIQYISADSRTFSASAQVSRYSSPYSDADTLVTGCFAIESSFLLIPCLSAG